MPANSPLCSGLSVYEQSNLTQLREVNGEIMEAGKHRKDFPMTAGALLIRTKPQNLYYRQRLVYLRFRQLRTLTIQRVLQAAAIDIATNSIRYSFIYKKNWLTQPQLN